MGHTGNLPLLRVGDLLRRCVSRSSLRTFSRWHSWQLGKFARWPWTSCPSGTFRRLPGIAGGRKGGWEKFRLVNTCLSGVCCQDLGCAPSRLLQEASQQHGGSQPVYQRLRARQACWHEFLPRKRNHFVKDRDAAMTTERPKLRRSGCLEVAGPVQAGAEVGPRRLASKRRMYCTRGLSLNGHNTSPTLIMVQI